MDSEARAARNELFQELRPRCVDLSELARRDDGTSKTSKALEDSANQLLHLLKEKCQRNDGIFDEKLADYVFFPLSLILRRKQTSSNRLTELTIKCLNILLVSGWRNTISVELAKQLLLLLTFIAGGVPGQDSKPAPEELVMEAYGALAALFIALGNTLKGSASLVEASTVPALGHCVTVILEGVTDGPSTETQLQALRALDAVWRCVKDQQALSTFLPGTISALTKSLMPSTGSKRSRKTLMTALEVLQYVLTSILSDIRTRSYKDKESTSGNEPQTLTKSWLKATTSQIKLALGNVIRLRKHDSVDVRKTLNRFCITILDECHETLAESSSMLVETCMMSIGIDGEGGIARLIASSRTTLVDLAAIHPDIGDHIKNTIYNWAISLPGVMQSNDETAKREALSRLSRTQELLSSLNLGSSILEDTLAKSLRDSVTVLFEPDSSKNSVQEAPFDLNSQALTTFASENALVKHFNPILMAAESQKETRTQLMSLLSSFGTRQSQISIASEMLEYMRGATGPSLLSAYWLSFHLLQAASSANADLDAFFNSSLTMSDEQEVVNQELFSYSLSVLSSDPSQATDWRLQGIALEVIASTAQRLQENFRTELIDTLYSVAQLLGSSNSHLRSHAITTLNTLASACGYTSTSDLIVSNADYMVNAISLRLNTFDISPRAPQVLVMMIRLTGPSLLLYLDDVVASIFAALDNFHGYHRLVELLFSVLGEIVEVGAKSDQLQITSGSPTTISHRKIAPTGPTISEIAKTITKRKSTQRKTSEPHEDFPREPWKSAKTLLDEAQKTSSPPDEDEPPSQEDEPPQELAKPTPTKIYAMLQNIVRLSQHYLTSQSPILRAKLLSLINISSNALQNDEDAFLPLINDIWPPLISRLYDSETFVVIAACSALSSLCEGAGDFLSSRITEEWGEIMKVVKAVKGKVKVEGKRKGGAGRGVFAQSNQVWEAVVKLLVSVVENVRIGDEEFEEVLELLVDLIPGRVDVREALVAVNADAVWLALYLHGQVQGKETPMLEGSQFVSLESGITA